MGSRYAFPFLTTWTSNPLEGVATQPRRVRFPSASATSALKEPPPLACPDLARAASIERNTLRSPDYPETRSSLDFPGPERGLEAPRHKPLNTRTYGRSCRRIAGFAPCERPRTSSSAPSGEPKRAPERCGTIALRVTSGPLVWIEVAPKPTGEHSINDKQPFCGHPLQRS